MKPLPTVEIFPAERSCEQGCPPCPLARREEKTTSLIIDPNVQASFSAFEKFIGQRKKQYRLFYSGPNDQSSFGLVPQMKNHGLVQEFGALNLSKVSSGNTNVYELALETVERIEWFLTTFFSQKLQTFRMTIVPEQLYVGEFEKMLISEIARGVFVKKLLEEKGEFVFEIRSNLVPLKNLERDIGQIELNNSVYLGSLVRDFWNEGDGKGLRGSLTQYLPDNGEFSMSFAEYYARTLNEYALKVTNRIISNSQRRIDKKFLIQQAKGVLGHEMHFAIAPQGVMCHHTSVAINNPILWMSHETFQREIPHLQSKFSKNDYNLIQQILLYENIEIFAAADSEVKRSVPEWISYFDEERYSPRFKRDF